MRWKTSQISLFFSSYGSTLLLRRAHLPRNPTLPSRFTTGNTKYTSSRRSTSDSRSVLMSWLVPCCRSGPPLASGFRLGEAWPWWWCGSGGSGGGGACASCSPSLLELSSPLAESDEELLPLLLICSMTSTSARSSAQRKERMRERDRASIRTNF